MQTTVELPRETRRRFGRTGFEVSPLGFGGAPIGLLKTEVEEVGRLLGELLDRGMNLIDTAHAYRGSEAAIGKAVASRRDEYVLVSKCGTQWKDDPDATMPAWSPEWVSFTIDRSLQRLQTDCLDVMLLHSCDRETFDKGEALGAAIAARDAGKVRYVGYSGDNETAAHAAAHPDIAVIQTSINICDQVNIDLVLPEAIRHDVGVMLKRPIANTAWRPLEEQYEAYRPYTEPYRKRFEAMGLELEAVQAACGETITWPEIALRFGLSFDGAHVAIVGSTKPAHVGSNMAAAARGPLPEAAVTLIRDAFAAARQDDWIGLT